MEKQKNQPLKKNKKHVYTKAIAFSDNRREIIIFTIVAFLAPVLLYLPTIAFGFTKLDDNLILQNNFVFLSDFGNIFKSFLTDQFIDRHTTFYRPIGTLSYMLDIKLSGGNYAWMYHLSNILILGFTSCLLFHLLKRFNIHTKMAMFGALIYYLHPLFVSTTAHIPNRSELLLSLFSLMSFLFIIEYLQKNKIIYLLGHWLTFTIALFCKETAVFLPFVFIIYYFAFSYNKRSANYQNQIKYLLVILLYIISGFLWYWVRSIALKGISDQDDNTFGIFAFFSNLRVIPEALAKFFLPSDIAPIPGFSLFNTMAGLGIIIIIPVLFFKNKERSKKEKVFCFSWFIILLVPSLLYKHPNLDYFDHRFFLPMIGILLFVMFIFPEKWIKNGKVKYSWLLVLIIVILSSFTIAKSRSYSDPMTFYSSAISKNPKSDFAYNNRGQLYDSQGKFDEAVIDYTKALELTPNSATVYNNRGLAYGNQGLFDKSINDLTKAIEINPKYAEAFINRGNSFNDIGLFDKAISDYTKAIELQPNFPIAYYNRGLTYNNQGLFDSAISNFTKAIELKPDYAEAYNNRGVLYLNKSMNDSACQNFRKAQYLGNQTGKNNYIKNCN